MAKLEDQVFRYVSFASFSTEDWRKVCLYCSRKGIKRLQKSQRPRSESTYRQFVEWFECGIGAGDVVKYEGLLALVSLWTPQYAKICAFMELDGNIVPCEKQVPPETLEKCGKRESDAFSYALRSQGYGFDVRSSVVYKHRNLSSGDIVTYEVSGTSGIGIVHECNENYIKFFFSIEDGMVLHSLEYERKAIVFKRAIPQERDGLFVNLERMGYQWSPKKKSLSKVLPKVMKGKMYYYLTDRFEIGKAVEDEKANSRLRYSNGNYFVTREEIEEFILKLKSIRGI